MNKQNLGSDITPSSPTRQQRLIELMSLKRLTFTELGRRLDISATAAKKLCLANTVPPVRVEQMAQVFNEFDIPANLLPIGYYRPPGKRNKPEKTSADCCPTRATSASE